MKKVVGITGGVGAGKSTVLNVLREEYRADIISTDEVAKELMMPGQRCFQEIVEAYSDALLNEDGELDKKKMGELVFNDKEAGDRINGIVHPAVKEEVIRRIQNSKRQLVAVESALLIEANLTDLCDEVWYIYVSVQDRVKRLYEQRGYSEVKSYQIMHRQLAHEHYSKASDRIIDNGFSKEYCRKQVRDFTCSLLGIPKEQED